MSTRLDYSFVGPDQCECGAVGGLPTDRSVDQSVVGTSDRALVGVHEQSSS